MEKAGWSIFITQTLDTSVKDYKYGLKWTIISNVKLLLIVFHYYDWRAGTHTMVLFFCWCAACTIGLFVWILIYNQMLVLRRLKERKNSLVKYGGVLSHFPYITYLAFNCFSLYWAFWFIQHLFWSLLRWVKDDCGFSIIHFSYYIFNSMTMNQGSSSLH